MPKINRFRIVNFRFDDDKKYIADELFEFDGKNSLINLENGGGKTVILQLALQVLQPNAQLGSRRFADYFKPNSGTVHIMTEWIQDTINPEYILTGICFAKGSDDLRYFTYIHSYTAANEYDVKNMPIVDDKKQVAQFYEFNKFLRELSASSKYRINIYSRDRQRDYSQKLETYNLFSDEFDAIRIINQTEGGIEKFFANARKSRHVIEKLIIPAMPQTEGDKEGLLAKTFKTHMENLKNIPIYQYRIKVYDSFLEKFNELLREVLNYEKKVDENFFYYKDLCILENMLVIYLKRLDLEISKAEEDIENEKNQISEMKYRKESLLYRKSMEELRSIESDHDDLIRKFNMLIEEENKLDCKIKQQYAANYYIDLVENRKRLVEQKTMLDAITKEKDELTEEYQNCLFYLKNILKEKLEYFDDQYNDLSAKKEAIENDITANAKNLAETNDERDKIKANIAVLQDNIENTQKELKKLSQYFWIKDAAFILEPEKSLKGLKHQEEDLIKGKEALSVEKANLQKSLEDNKIKESNTTASLAGLKVKVSGVENDIKAYNDRKNQLMNRAAVYEVYGDIYSESFIGKLKEKRGTTSDSIVRELNNFHDMQKKKLLLEGCDYYIPDYEIKKVYEFFVENDIKCIPGTLWLLNQSREKREELLGLNPLIQYSIVIEESEIKRIKTISNKICELVLEYPAVLVVNSENGIKMRVENVLENHDNNGEGLDRVGAMDMYVVRAYNTRLALDKEAFIEYVGKIDANLLDISDKINRYKEDESRVNELIVNVEGFTSSYPESYIKELLENLEQINAEIGKCSDELIKLAGQRKGIEKSIDEIEKNIIDCDIKTEEIRSDIEKLSTMIELEAKNKENKTVLDDLMNQEKMIENKKSNLEAKLEDLRTQLSDVKDKCRANREIKSQTNSKISEIEALVKIENLTMKIEGSQDETEARIKGLERKITSEQADFIMSNIKNIEKNIEHDVKAIRKNGFEEDDLLGMCERISEEEIQENENALQKKKTEINALEKEERELKSKKDKLTGVIQNMSKNIIDIYGKPPFEFEETSFVDIDMYEKQIKDIIRKQKRDEEKLAALKERKGSIREILASLNAAILSSAMGEEKKKQINFTEYGNLSDGTSIWDITKMTNEEIAVLKNSEYNKYKKSLEELGASREKVNETYEKLYGDRQWEDNETIKRILADIMKENIYNFEYLKKMFDGIFVTVDNMKKATKLQLDESLENKNEIVERSYRRAETVYTELKMVDGFSKIRVGNVNVKTVEIQVPPLSTEKGKDKMAFYIDNCINEIEDMKANKTYDPGKIDDEIIKMMSPVRLLDAVIDLNEISIKVYKPESNIELSRHIPWETVVEWSGGEKLAGYFAMFISIISYLRYKKTNWHGSSKVIWVDNPFGQANAGHLLSYIFDLAKASNTQMICLTGLQEVNIYAQFDVVYSLVHRMLMSNVSVIKSNVVKSGHDVETAFYKVERDQMSFI